MKSISYILAVLALPECPVHHFLHVYCPGCGITRATAALLELDVVSSIRYNPMMVGFLVYVLALAVGLGLEKAGVVSSDENKKARKVLTGAFLFAWLVYFIARNVALLVFGDDWLGDFS